MADNNTVVLSPDLMAAVELYAQTAKLSVNAVVEEALRFHLDADPEFNAVRREHLNGALALGLTPEEYVVKLVHEDRAERRAQVS